MNWCYCVNFRYNFAQYAMSQPYSFYWNNPRLEGIWRPYNRFDVYFYSNHFWNDWAFNYPFNYGWGWYIYLSTWGRYCYCLFSLRCSNALSLMMLYNTLSFFQTSTWSWYIYLSTWGCYCYSWFFSLRFSKNASSFMMLYNTLSFFYTPSLIFMIMISANIRRRKRNYFIKLIFMRLLLMFFSSSVF
jgi:hypothetical protein